MVLVLTNSKDATADFLCEHLQAKRVKYFRLDTDTLAREVTVSYSRNRARLVLGSSACSPEHVRALWLRRPTSLHLPGTQPTERLHAAAEWAEAVEGFLAHIPCKRWINHPSANAAASHKMEQLTRARKFGLQTPATIVTQDATAAETFFKRHGGRIIAKPLAAGYLERRSRRYDSVIYTTAVSSAEIAKSTLIRRCPTLLQERIAKRSDIRLVFLDGRLSAVQLTASDEDHQQRLDIRRRNMEDVTYQAIHVPDQVAAPVRALIKSYNLRFAALDFAVDYRGKWVFFEVNPNGQWAWLDIEAGTKIADSFVTAFHGT